MSEQPPEENQTAGSENQVAEEVNPEAPSQQQDEALVDESPPEEQPAETANQDGEQLVEEAGPDLAEERGDQPVPERPSSAGKTSSRPTSATRPASGGGPGSAAREGSGGQPDSSEEVPAGERPTSATRPPTGDRPGSAARPSSGERPDSAARPLTVERPGSATRPPVIERPGSATRPPTGERPGSAARPPSGGRPTSARKSPAEERPPSAGRPGSAVRTASGGRPGSVAQPASGERQGSTVRPPSGDRPGSARRPATGERPVSATRPVSGSAGRSPSAGRPGSAARPPSGGRLGSVERPPSGTRPTSGRDAPQEEEAAIEDGLMQPTALEENTAAMIAQNGIDDEDDEPRYHGFGRGQEEEEGSDISDDESEMVVLDPDHPLMKRFQDALSSHLDKQLTKINLEVRELSEALKTKQKEREEVGVNLYGLQQELAKQQMNLEKHHDKLGQLGKVQSQVTEELEDVRSMYKHTQQNVIQQRKEASALQTELENVSLHLFYLTNAKEDIRGDIAVMRRAAEKADSEVSQAEVDKQKQDLYVDRLTENVDKLREAIALYEAQTQAQSDETKAAKEALAEARMEIESINLEKKQLYQQWNSSLIGMKRRDEAHAAMNEALRDEVAELQNYSFDSKLEGVISILNIAIYITIQDCQQKQQILSLSTEIDGYKKSIQKEQETNETLTLLLQKNEIDINTLKKQISTSQAKQEQLKQEYSAFSRMLHETEQNLNRATTDRTLRQNELVALRKQIEREYLEKLQLEESIMDAMRSKLTADKVSHYAKKVAGKVRRNIGEQEAARAKVENEISQDTLELSHTNTRVERLQKGLQELDKEIHEKNQIISHSEAEIVKRNAVIERKQGLIDQYNKKVEAIASEQGGEELGPLEAEVAALSKGIDTRNQEIADLQQFWLRQQMELVKMSKEKDSQQREVDTMKKALTILHQKKMRIENDINTQLNERKDVECNIRNMQNDMLKLNLLLTKEGKTKESLQQDNILIENDFVLSLRESEKESIEMQNKLEEMGEEKERLLNSLVEAERQIMLWEKKTQLAREAKATVDSEVGQGEIRAMISEIHRMEVRHTQLMKLQEKLIQDMEKSVSRRDTIVTRGDAQAKLHKKVETKGAFQKKLAELKKKIKQTQQDADSCDRDIVELRSHQQMLSKDLEENQKEFHQLQSMADTLDGDIERFAEVKQKNMTDLLAKQQKIKHYQALKDGKYTLLCKTEAALAAEMQKQTDKTHTIATIIDRLNQEFPHIQPAMRPVVVALSSRGGNDED